MTDDQMDARLRAAGERWRTTNESVATVDVEAATAPTVEPIAPRPPRRHWALLASAAVVTAAIVVGGTIVLRGSGNGTGPSADTAPLENTVWVLTGPEGTRSDALLQITNGHLVADDDCRIVTGNAAVQGDTLTVTDQVVRYKSCTDQYGPGIYEQGTKVLDGTSTFTITADGLKISNDGGALAFHPADVNTPAPTADYPTFAATPWLLVSAKDANGDPIPVAGDPTVRFDPDGTLQGSDGCNSLSGTFTGDVPRITFGDVGGSEVYCPGDRGATETAILALMKGAVNVGGGGGELTLTKGAAELVYRWNPEASASNDPQNLQGIQWRLDDAGDGGYGLASGAPFQVQPGSSLVDVAHGTLRVTGATDDPVLKLLGHSLHVWSIVDGRLRIVVDDVQGRSLGFSSDATAGDIPLTGTTWRLDSASDGSTTHQADANSGQGLTISGDQLQANDGVNALSGSVQVGDNTLTLKQISTTDIGSTVDDPVRDLVDTVLVDGDVGYAIDGQTLTLTRDANVLTYQATHSASGATSILGLWELTTIATGTGPDGTASPPTAPLTLRFAGDTGMVDFDLNCGPVKTGFTSTADALVIDAWTVPTDPCPQGSSLASTEEEVFIHVLSGKSTYSIDRAGMLTITKSGIGALVFSHSD